MFIPNDCIKTHDSDFSVTLYYTAQSANLEYCNYLIFDQDLRMANVLQTEREMYLFWFITGI